MNRRRASMLIEIIICMSIGSSLTLLAIGVVHQAMTMSSRASGQTDLGRAGARLAQQFRADVHSAAEIAIENDSSKLRIRYAEGGDVVYQISDRQMLRRKFGETGQAVGEIERESYDFGQGSLMSFATLEEPQRAELIVRREHDLQHETPRLELHVAAVVGKLAQAQQSAGDAP